MLDTIQNKYYVNILEFNVNALLPSTKGPAIGKGLGARINPWTKVSGLTVKKLTSMKMKQTKFKKENSWTWKISCTVWNHTRVKLSVLNFLVTKIPPTSPFMQSKFLMGSLTSWV